MQCVGFVREKSDRERFSFCGTSESSSVPQHRHARHGLRAVEPGGAQGLPDVQPAGGARLQALALGQQRGVLASATALSPVVGYRLGEEDHFQSALSLLAGKGLPWCGQTPAPLDYKFAAWQTVKYRSKGVSRRPTSHAN